VGILQRHPRQWRLASGVMIAVASVALVATWRVRPLHLTFIYLASGLVLGPILVLIGHPVVVALRDRRLVDLGVISYGLYLYHPILSSLIDTLGRNWLLDVLKFPALIVVAALTWVFIERPVLRLKILRVQCRTALAPRRPRSLHDRIGEQQSGNSGSLIRRPASEKGQILLAVRLSWASALANLHLSSDSAGRTQPAPL
jgi:peptidoglycan/LPS O-acetylase OafA/YrhL